MHAARPDQTIRPLNWVRAAAALMVVAFHSHAVFALPKYFAASVLPILGAGDSGVQLFFVLSGFVILLAHRSDPERSADALRTFALKRFRRIYPPLWLVLLALAPVVLSGVFASAPSPADVALAFLILPAPVEPILAVEWTLRHEILFYALFAVFLWSRRLGLVLLLLWGGVGAACAFAIPDVWPTTYLSNANHLLFLLGMGAAFLYLRGERRGARAALAGGVAVFALAYAMSLGGAASRNLCILLAGLGATGVIYGLAAGPWRNRSVRWLDEAGNASYMLYLIHFPLVSAAAKVAVFVDRRFPVPPALLLLSIVAFCQAAALLAHAYVERPLMRWVASRGTGRESRALAASAGGSHSGK